MARAHLFRPVTDEEGNLLYGAEVSVRRADVLVPLDQTIYTGPLAGASVLPNPFPIDGGYIDIWLDEPQRVNLLIKSGGRSPISIYLDVQPPAGEVLRTEHSITITNAPYDNAVLIADGPGTASWQDTPVAPPGAVAAHSHDGAGASSTSLGTGAAAAGAQATAVGDSADASGDSSTAFGYLATADGVSGTAVGAQSTATGNDSTAVGTGASSSDGGTSVGRQASASGGRAAALGKQAQASGVGAVAVGNASVASGVAAVAVGQGASATQDRSTAFGAGAVSSHARSVAFGPGATTTAEDQVALGGPGSTVVVLGDLRTDQDAKIAGATGTLAFFGAAGATKQTVTGTVTDPALAAVLTILSDMGLITDSTTA